MNQQQLAISGNASAAPTLWGGFGNQQPGREWNRSDVNLRWTWPGWTGLMSRFSWILVAISCNLLKSQRLQMVACCSCCLRYQFKPLRCICYSDNHFGSTLDRKGSMRPKALQMAGQVRSPWVELRAMQFQHCSTCFNWRFPEIGGTPSHHPFSS